VGNRPKKQVRFVGASLEDLRGFPKAARVDVGHQLSRLEDCLDPDHFKPMPEVGLGAAEIKIDVGQQFRVFYVAKLKTGIYVLHTFEKKSQKTAKHDIRLGAKRYSEALARDEAIRNAAKEGNDK